MAEMVAATMGPSDSSNEVESNTLPPTINDKISVDMTTIAPEDLERFRSLFASVDLDNSGTITHDELTSLFKSLELEATDEEIHSLIEVVDVDHSGTLNFEEFVTMICLIAANEDKEKEQQHAHLRAVFDSVDSDKSGTISTDELGELFRTSLGYPDTTPEEIAQLIQLVDSDGNGVLDFEEFVTLMDLFLQHEQQQHAN